MIGTTLVSLCRRESFAHKDRMQGGGARGLLRDFVTITLQHYIFMTEKIEPHKQSQMLNKQASSRIQFELNGDHFSRC